MCPTHDPNSTPRGFVAASEKRKSDWSGEFWADLGERVLASFLGGVLALLGTAGATPLDWNDPALLWSVVGLPTAFSLVKGLLANVANAESGPSLLPSPPAPEIKDAENLS